MSDPNTIVLIVILFMAWSMTFEQFLLGDEP